MIGGIHNTANPSNLTNNIGMHARKISLRPGGGASGYCPRTSPVSTGARVAGRTDAETNFHVTLRLTRCGSQTRAPEQCAEAPTGVRPANCE
jgi:hypothetical protein